MIKQVEIPQSDWLSEHLKQNSISKNADKGIEGTRVFNLIPKGYSSILKIFHWMHVNSEQLPNDIKWDDITELKKDKNDVWEKLLKESTLSYSTLGTENSNAERISWETVSTMLGVKFNSTINPNVFLKHFNNSFPTWLFGAEEGTLTEREISIVLEILNTNYANSNFYFHFELLKLIPSGLNPLPEELRFSGDIQDLPRFLSYEKGPFSIWMTPDYFWPERREFCFCTDYDMPYSILATNDNSLIDNFMNSELECFEINYDDRLDFGSYNESL